jgi:biopolymer transport protein ExbD
MGITLRSGKGGAVSDVTIVPLIDILLVLLVIFMIISFGPMGLPASLPQETGEPGPVMRPETIIVEVASDGTIRLNGSVVQLDELRGRVERVFPLRGHRVVFLQGDRSLEFQVVAEVLDVVHVAGTC